ncbi:MAG: glycosyltransferase [Candidatus Omnitrophica bacterium]|nr:glycosyltransferase [Candidatus Omnitrophota bacterium]
MHVLQMLPSLTVGGVERGVLDLTKGLLQRGHRVSVVSSGGPLVGPLTRLGAAHHQLPVHDKFPLTAWRCLPSLSRLIQDTDIDVVHARSRAPAWIGWAAARRTQRPFVTTAHGFYRPHPLSRVMVWGRLVIAPSAALGDYLVQQFGLRRDRLRVIPRGVDLEAFAFQPPPDHDGPWRIGLVGRLTPLKGHEVALHACARLRRQGLPVRLCLAGDAPHSPRREMLDDLAASLGLQDAVEWLGLRYDIPELIASMDVVVVPSQYPESFGRGVVEAQAVGRPVVASRLGGLSELIEDGQTGLLVPPSDPEALARAVARFCHDAPLRARCVEAARRRVESDYPLDRMVEHTLAVYDECLNRPRVLIWKLGALGDVVLASPSLRAVRHHFPNGRISLVVGRAAHEVVARCPHLDDIVLYDPARKDRGARGAARFVRRLRQEAFDLSLDLQNSRRTHLMSWLAGIPVRAGYRRKFGWLLNRGVRLPRVVLAPVAHQHYLLRQAGLSTDGDALEVWPSEQDAQAVTDMLPRALLGSDEPLVGVHPGGSGRWRTKRWDLERWAQVCDALGARGVRVIVTGGPDEAELGERLRARTKMAPLMAVGKTSVMELACLIKRCAVFIAQDSSPLHLAAAVGTPAIALFGPTDPARHLPPRFRGAVLYKRVFCSPCYSPRCRTVTHACMKRIGVDEVVAAVLRLLQR